ncbi:hypothetical protein KAU11_11380 [Candidatus Babeliales bacterium]|nr:hypothetical protein [Candidatus Babeliales bacterium]
MNVIVKETAKEKGGVSKLLKVLREAKNKAVGTFDGINFKKVGKTIILF